MPEVGSRTRRFRVLWSVLIASACSGTLPAQTLSKGHRILLERGTQVQGMVTAGDVFHLDTYRTADYTSINWLWDSNPSQHGDAPGFPWARWVHSQSQMPPQAGESPYMSRLVALQLGDEWNLNDPTIRTNAVNWFNAVRDQYPNTILYNNNFGGQVNDAALADFISRARPDMICFDTYPFRSDYTTRQPITPPGGSHSQWFSELRRYRQHAMGNGIPFGTYTQTFHAVQDYDQTVYRDPSESEMNLNTFGALAFDVKYLTDFTYNTGASSLFTPPGGDSNPTPLYHRRKEINRQVKNLSPALARLTSINKLNANTNSVDTMIIRGKHTTGPGTSDWNALPIGFDVDLASPGYSDWEYQRNDPYFSGFSVTNIGTKNDSLRGDVILSWFKVLDESLDGPAAGEVYIMVLNALTDAAGTGAECRQSINLDFSFGSSGITTLQRLSRDTGLVETVTLTVVSNKRRLTVELDGGMADLFKFNTGAPFVGVPDAAPPAAVTGFAATTSVAPITLRWTNPANYDFTGTLLRRKTGGFPADIDDGDLVLDRFNLPGSSDSFVDAGLPIGVRYYYAAFAHDAAAHYAPAATAIGARVSAADFDRDTDVDLEDFVVFQRCFNGPNRPPKLPGCDIADLDIDTDVDLADFMEFQSCFNGPNRPPKCQ